ncbi:alpha-tubulin N-acetyltransferase-like [Brevipalpus obovatus]|uniref:alpha-tubulin N-acetyltransferase-like n=1 Tax=Brevipalpus obovatus TaxID=246614 RepID=UPI003D9E3020
MRMNLPSDLHIIQFKSDGSLRSCHHPAHQYICGSDSINLGHDPSAKRSTIGPTDSMGSFGSSLLQSIRSKLPQWIDDLGIGSANAQNLKEPITSYSKFIRGSFRPYSPNKHSDSIFFLVKLTSKIGDLIDPLALGFVRVGKRNLFLENQGQLINIPECFSILDFYLTQQRQGFGYLLISNALKNQSISINRCAFDRPTQAMISFLSKHFNLNEPQRQHNHFVIYKQFFETDNHS